MSLTIKKFAPQYYIGSLTISWAICLIFCSTFMRYVVDFLLLHLGGLAGVGIFVWIIFAISGLAGAWFLLRQADLKTWMLEGLIILIGVIFAIEIKDPVERIHLVEFGLLGAFSASDQLINNKFIKSLLFAMLTGLLVATLDEMLQFFIPRRFADIRDIIFGLLGATWGASMYLVAKNSFK